MDEPVQLLAHELVIERLRTLIEEIKTLHFSLTYAGKSAEAACAFRVLISFLMDMHLTGNQQHDVSEGLEMLSGIATEYGMGEYAGELRAARSELLGSHPRRERKIH